MDATKLREREGKRKRERELKLLLNQKKDLFVKIFHKIFSVIKIIHIFFVEETFVISEQRNNKWLRLRHIAKQIRPLKILQGR